MICLYPNGKAAPLFSFPTTGVSSGPDASINSTPVLVGSLLYVSTTDGMLKCLDISADPVVVKFDKKVCAACASDPGSLAAGDGVIVMGGMTEAPVQGLPTSFTDVVHAVDMVTGTPKWKVKVSPSIMLVPSVAPGAVVFMSSAGDVCCHKPADGAVVWEAKGSMATMGTGGAAIIDGRVYASSNRKGKRVWNLPFGGKGMVRAFKLGDGELVWERHFDLEANTIPAMCCVGPRGKPTVVVALGSNPGFPDNHETGKATGNEWPGKVVSLDPADGATLWEFQPPTWTGYSCAGVTKIQARFAPPGWMNPVVGGDGTIYAAWNCDGTLYAIKGETGKEISKYQFGHPFMGQPVVLPGMLFVNMVCDMIGLWKVSVPAPGTVVRELAQPLAVSSTEHFWPQKHNDPRCLGQAPYQCPTDLSTPAWVFRLPEKLVDDWLGNSPVIDAQRNCYISGNFSDVFVVRPDGTLRGSVDVGPYPATVALAGPRFYTSNSLGIAHAVNIETLEIEWSVKFCGWCMPDNYAALVYDGTLFLPGFDFPSLEDPKYQDLLGKAGGRWWWESGAWTCYALDITDGHTKWKFTIPGKDGDGAVTVLWNFTPTIYEDRIVFLDYHMGVYCCNRHTGEKHWEHIQDNATFSTGNQAGDNKGKVFVTGNMRMSAVDGIGAGFLVCWDIMKGEHKWFKYTTDAKGNYIPCNQGPAIVPANADKGCDSGICVVQFMANIGAPDSGCEELRQTGLPGKLVGYDAETGDEKWSFLCPLWYHDHCASTFVEDPGLTWPDSAGGLAVDGRGTVYSFFSSGMVYAVNGYTGEILSRYETYNSSNAQICLAPGMVVATGSFTMFCWRDPGLEEAWLEEARAKEDPRATVPLLDIPPSGDTKHPPKPTPAWFPPCCKDEHPDSWQGPYYANQYLEKEFSRYVEVWRPLQAEATEKCREYSKQHSLSSTKDASARKQGGEGARWQVVGGGEKGIVVRREAALNSAEMPRLAKGAVIEEIEKKGDRLHYQKLDGDGPDYGWVSFTFKGTPLLQCLS